MVISYFSVYTHSELLLLEWAKWCSGTFVMSSLPVSSLKWIKFPTLCNVIILDEDEDDEGQMGSQEPSGSQPISQSGSQSSQQSLVPPLQPIMAPDRQISMGRNQLTPFMLGVIMNLFMFLKNRFNLKKISVAFCWN